MRELALFVGGLFIAPWIVDWILGLVLPPASGTLSSFLVRFVPVVWTPTFLALLFVGSAAGARGVREELTARLAYKRGSGLWLMAAAIVPVLAMVIAVFSARALGHSTPFISANAIPTMVGLQLITGAVGEELGWRGFLLPRLSRHLGKMSAAWVMATLWALWHVPAWFNPALPHHTMPIIPALLSVAFLGVFLAYVFNRAGESVLATIAAHLSFNIMIGLGGVRLSSPVFWVTLAVVFGALAVLLTITARRWPAVIGFSAPSSQSISAPARSDRSDP